MKSKVRKKGAKVAEGCMPHPPGKSRALSNEWDKPQNAFCNDCEKDWLHGAHASFEWETKGDAMDAPDFKRSKEQPL